MTRLFTISEIKHLVKESTRERLLFYEQSDINQQIALDHELGFEAILTGNGDEKILLPEERPTQGFQEGYQGKKHLKSLNRYERQSGADLARNPHLLTGRQVPLPC